MSEGGASFFSSRWGMLLAMMGMAVGTGNIWRFPRIAATQGGGSFLVAWVVFLLLWSVPLLILEFALGKAARVGPVGAFVKMLGPKFGWMGAWVALTATAIMFTYSVVMGWTLRFLVAAIAGGIPSDPPVAFWEGYAAHFPAVVTHAAAMGLGVLVVAKGVRGIERVTRVMIPTLAFLVLILAVRAITLPGAVDGLAFLFTPNWSDLASAEIWLQALTQNAWDTGAGWGLVLCYAIYARRQEDTALNAFVIGFGNNAMSLLAGIMVLCTVFSIMPGAASEIVGAGNEGLTFTWVPQLFDTLPFGRILLVLFFLALFFAAWSSLIAMIELASRVLIDLGLERSRAIALVGAAGLIFGTPSALNMDVFGNQDFVWSVGLMLSGFFFAVAVLRYGVTRWRMEFVNTEHSDIRIGGWWDWAIRLVALQAVVLIGWWLWQVRGEGFAANWNPFESANVGTLVAQWAIVLAALIAANGALVKRTRRPAD